MMPLAPRLRRVSKSTPLYPLGHFPPAFIDALAGAICAHAAVRGDSLEGTEWEEIFARCVGAEWKPSNVGLDDIVHRASSTAWGAKTVKHRVRGSRTSSKRETVRLISGRNSPQFSFEKNVRPHRDDPDEIGRMVLDIWNERVKEIRSLYANVRTVVLLKDFDGELLRLCIFEFETVMFQAKDFRFSWNKNNNLEGRDGDGEHRFTWQPHGSQFTVVEDVPESAVRLELYKPKRIEPKKVLEALGFDKSWYKLI